MGIIISITSKKGGSAKTTTSVNLSAALAERGKKVLVVDMDSQGHATTSLGRSPYSSDFGLYEILTQPDFDIRKAVYPLAVENMALIPANFKMENLSNLIANERGSGFILKDKLAEIKSDYDFIFIDTPATVNLMVINALAAADGVIIPMQQHFLSMDSLAQILKFINKIKDKANPELQILGIVPTIVEIYTTHNKRVLHEILGHFGQKLFNTRIHKDIKLAEAPSYGQPITVYAGKSRGAEDYRSLAEEVLAYEKS